MGNSTLTGNFRELERVIDSYFSKYFAPELDRLVENEKSRFHTALEKSAPHNYKPDELGFTLGVAGFDRKTEDELVAECKSNLLGDSFMQGDIKYIADKWRELAVERMGQEEYDAMCKEAGGDIAVTYILNHLDKLYIDKLVKDGVPKSSGEYIIRTAMDSSLVSFGSPSSTALEDEVKRRQFEGYGANAAEKAASLALSAGTDIALTCGGSSLATIGKYLLAEGAVRGAAHIIGSDGESLDCEETEKWICDRVMAAGGTPDKQNKDIDESTAVDGYDFIEDVESMLFYKTDIGKDRKKAADGARLASAYAAGGITGLFKASSEIVANEIKGKTADDAAAKAAPITAGEPLSAGYDVSNVFSHSEKEIKEGDEINTEKKDSDETVEDEKDTAKRTAQSGGGWGSLLSSAGLDGLTDVGKHLPYICAMLPDMLVGLFTGKGAIFNAIGKNLLPIASIIMGMFTKNTLLKTLLIGGGGLNLLNKAGHAVLENDEPQKKSAYAGEELDERLANVRMNGRNLVMDIDGVPYILVVDERVAAKVKDGTLPLNTLANAALRRVDAGAAVDVSRSYDDDISERRDTGLRR